MISNTMFKRRLRCHYGAITTVVIINFLIVIYLMTCSFQTETGNHTDLYKGDKAERLPRNNSFHFRLTFNDSSIGIRIKESVGSSLVFHTNDHVSMSKTKVRRFVLRQTDSPNTPAMYKNVFLFSAIGRRTGDGGLAHDVAVNMWETAEFSDRPMSCCYLYNDGKISRGLVIRKSLFLNNSLTAVQVLCKTKKGNDRHIGVTLVYGNDFCVSDVNSYVKIKAPKPCLLTFCFAICAKIAYGYVNPELIVEWMEYNTYMGVSYVVVFTYNLTSDAMEVLKFYEKQGLVEVLQFDYPAKNSPVHKIGDKVIASWTDEQLTVYDCHDRLRGYDFVGIIDLDEFVVPKHGNFEQMMINLSKKYPTAASFTFMSEIHALEWGRDKTVSSSLIPQFTKHTKVMEDRPKLVHMPKFVEPGGITTHGVLPKTGYRRISVIYHQAVIKHYRPCRKEWIDKGTCFNRTLYTDTHMADIFKNIDDKIAAAKEHILGIT